MVIDVEGEDIEQSRAAKESVTSTGEHNRVTYPNTKGDQSHQDLFKDPHLYPKNDILIH